MKNFLKYTPVILLWVVILLTALNFVGEFSYRGIDFKGINILSSVVDDSIFYREKISYEVPDLRLAVNRIIEKNTPKIDTSFILSEIKKKPTYNRDSSGIVLFEDFSEGGRSIKKIDSMLHSGGQIRIAMMGDSYLEGDIIAKDIRDDLQNNFGGGGVGFMPITTGSPYFRPTIYHSYSDNWQTKSIIKNPRDSRYLISGYTYHPSERGWVAYRMPKSENKNLSRVQRASLLYTASDSLSTVELKVNGGVVQKYNLQQSAHLQSLTVEQDSIGSVLYTFGNVGELTLYGAIFDDLSGVSVDNYFMRGNRGDTMCGVDSLLTADYNSMFPVNMIIMEYGLNISLESDISALQRFTKRMVRVVSHIQSCYPGVPIVIMGVGERLVLKGGELRSMKSVIDLDHFQRELARQTRCIFWSTRDAINNRGGLESFVKKGWAAKDYTHLGFGGGKAVADQFISAWQHAVD